MRDVMIGPVATAAATLRPRGVSFLFAEPHWALRASHAGWSVRWCTDQTGVANASMLSGAFIWLLAGALMRRTHKGGLLTSSRAAVDRASSFVFLLGKRHLGTVMIHAQEPDAARYRFTSALAAQLSDHVLLLRGGDLGAGPKLFGCSSS